MTPWAVSACWMALLLAMAFASGGDPAIARQSVSTDRPNETAGSVSGAGIAILARAGTDEAVAEKAPANQRVALKVVAARATQAVPPVPTELRSMQLLYGEGYRKSGSVVETPDPQGLRVNKEPGYHHTIIEYVIPWLTATVTLNGSTYFIATGQGHAVIYPRQPEGAAHVQSAYISAIWFALQDNRWVVVGKTWNLAVDGTFGVVNGKPWSPFPQMFLLKNAALLVPDEGGYMQGGYGNSWYSIYQFSVHGLQFLGKVPSGADNTGAGTMPVISIDGRIAAAATPTNDHPQVTIVYNGRTELQNRLVDLHSVSCTFVYWQDAAHPDQSGFKPMTSRCKAIVNSMR